MVNDFGRLLQLLTHINRIVLEGTPVTLLRLAPYSPMLNLVETIWSKVKAFVKANLRVPVVKVPAVVEQRHVCLENIIDKAKNIIVGGDCARAVQHTTVRHPAALRMVTCKLGAESYALPSFVVVSDLVVFSFYSIMLKYEDSKRIAYCTEIWNGFTANVI